MEPWSTVKMFQKDSLKACFMNYSLKQKSFLQSYYTKFIEWSILNITFLHMAVLSFKANKLIAMALCYTGISLGSVQERERMINEICIREGSKQMHLFHDWVKIEFHLTICTWGTLLVQHCWQPSLDGDMAAEANWFFC